MATDIYSDLSYAAPAAKPTAVGEIDLATEAYDGSPAPPTCAPEVTALDYQQVRGPDPTAPQEAGSVWPLTPKRFGKYEVLEKIGGGGMGIVYKARDSVLDRFVALKTIRNGVLADQEEIDRFLREAKAVAQLRDPHIIAIYDFGLHEGVPYFVMELLPGTTLTQKVEHYSKAPPREAVSVVEKIARALQVAHSKGIVHRDIKPGNVLEDENGEPKVSDFGLAKFLESDSDWTRTGRMIGTPAYMSPEQTAGLHEKITPATDVWALGVVLYELLTKHRPFAGKSNEELKSNIATRVPTAPTKKRRDLPRSLEAIILKCLEKNPARRYQQATALADDLARWQAGLAPQAKPLAWWQASMVACRRFWMPLAFAGLLVAMTCAWFTLYLLSPPQLSWSQALQAKVAKDNKAIIIGDKGRPDGFAWIVGSSTSTAEVNEQGVFWVNSGKSGLMQLFQPGDFASYSFQADILHETAGKGDSEVGIYASQAVFPHSKGVARSFIKFRFNDLRALADKAPGKVNHGSSLVQHVVYQDPENGGEANFYSQEVQFVRKPKAWRTLRFEVKPQQLSAHWWDDNQWVEVARWSSEDVHQYAKTLLSTEPMPFQVDDLPRSFSGGFGLYLFRGSILVKNVLIEKL